MRIGEPSLIEHLEEQITHLYSRTEGIGGIRGIRSTESIRGTEGIRGIEGIGGIGGIGGIEDIGGIGIILPILYLPQGQDKTLLLNAINASVATHTRMVLTASPLNYCSFFVAIVAFCRCE